LSTGSRMLWYFGGNHSRLQGKEFMEKNLDEHDVEAIELGQLFLLHSSNHRHVHPIIVHPFRLNEYDLVCSAYIDITFSSKVFALFVFNLYHVLYYSFTICAISIGYGPTLLPTLYVIFRNYFLCFSIKKLFFTRQFSVFLIFLIIVST
jgi:hypothetical protein